MTAKTRIGDDFMFVKAPPLSKMVPLNDEILADIQKPTPKHVFSKEQKRLVEVIMKTLWLLENRNSPTVAEVVNQVSKSRKIGANQVVSIMRILFREGEIFQPKPGHVRTG